MITFRCGACAERVEAGDDAAGRAVKCQRCGHVNVCPWPSAPVAEASSPSRRPHVAASGHVLLATLGVIVLGGSGWLAWSELDGTRAGALSALSPAEALQRQLLQQDVDKPGDATLVGMFNEINTNNFGGKLPSMPVVWEDDLKRVGPLAGQAFTLEGMFGHLGRKSAILLNPDLQDDPAGLKRALCHEMVHAYLYSSGDTSTDHGPNFQAALKHLSEQGAFEGLPATDEERASLRGWLDAESKRLDGERQYMENLGADIERQKSDVEQAIAEYNSRGDAASSGGSGNANLTNEAINALREAYNQRAIDANARAEQDKADLEHFNDEVARYNLMLVYPDGVDEHARVAPKTDSAPRSGGR